MSEGILGSHSDNKALGSNASAPRSWGRRWAWRRHTVTRRRCWLTASSHFNLRAWGPDAAADHPPPPPRRWPAPPPTPRHTGRWEHTAAGPSTTHGTGQGAGVAQSPGRAAGPWGGAGESRRCSPVLGSSPAVGESKVVAGGHFGIFPQPAGHCGGGDRGAAAAGAMTGGPARGGGGERTRHTEGQGRETARERRVRVGASGPTPARRPLPKHGHAEHRLP